MAVSTISAPQVIQHSTTGIHYYKTGRVVYCNYDLNSVTASAGEAIKTIPAEFIPIRSISFRDRMNNCALQIGEDGNFTAIDAIPTKNIRGGVTYISRE